MEPVPHHVGDLVKDGERAGNDVWTTEALTYAVGQSMAGDLGIRWHQQPSLKGVVTTVHIRIPRQKPTHAQTIIGMADAMSTSDLQITPFR